jgi:hypothetical protein
MQVSHANVKYGVFCIQRTYANEIMMNNKLLLV